MQQSSTKRLSGLDALINLFPMGLAAWLFWYKNRQCPAFADDTVNLVIFVAVLLGWVLTLRFQARRLRVVILVLLFLAFLFTMSINVVCERLQPRGTAYLIIDRSRNMRTTVQDFELKVREAVDEIDENLDVGMLV